MAPTLTLEEALEQRDALVWCLEHGLGLAETSALIQLSADRSADNLAFAQQLWEPVGPISFWEAVEEVTGQCAVACEECGRATWSDETSTVHGYRSTITVGDDCCLGDFYRCYYCEEYYHETTTIEDGSEWCEDCLDENYLYCETCDVWHRDDDSHDHDDCDCEPPLPRFHFPANGAGTVANDEPIDVALPAGTITEEGMNAITTSLRYSIRAEFGINQLYNLPVSLAQLVQDVGPTWQTKQGNFTKRLSSALYKLGIKLPDGALSDIGNIARQHSSTESSWHVAFTRRLNESAKFFFHEASCWWRSYSASRCCLKSWGGLGMRTLTDSGIPTGRAWVQPLDADLKPSHDTTGARAYLVYNGYGDLSGYTAARIVAHLTDKTYTRIGFGGDHLYVNGEVAYLVADAATCQGAVDVRFDCDEHDQRDAKAVTAHGTIVAA